MNYVPSHNRKFLEETLAGSNSNVVKTTLSDLRSFKMILPYLQVLQISFLTPLLLCHINWRVLGIAF